MMATILISIDEVCVVVQAGLVSSGGSLDYTEQDMAFMVKQKVAVKEMEAAAVAWVAALFQTPMFSIKSITDIVDGKASCHTHSLLAPLKHMLCIIR